MAEPAPWEEYAAAPGPWQDYAEPTAAPGADAGFRNDEGLLEVDLGAGQPKPPEPSIGRSLALGVGDVAQGVGSLLGLVGNPLNATINAVAGTDLSTDLGKTLRDMTGAPAPATDSEELASAINQGGTGALTNAGLAGAAAKAGAGAVAEAMASNTVREFITGMAGGGGAKVGNDVGGVPGAIIGGFAGGAAGLGGARIAERLAEKFPRSVMLDEAGQLTEDGREIAQRVGADLDEVQKSYGRVRRATPRSLDALHQPAQPRIDHEAEAQKIIDAMSRRLSSSAGGGRDVVPPPPFEEAASEGVRLTRGQAEQDFAVQNDENSLKVSASKEGDQARQWFNQQAETIRAARDRFLSAFGDTAENKADRGARLQDAVQTLRDSGAAGVRQLYRSAEELGGDALNLETDGIRHAATDVLIDESVPEPVKRSVSQELARYGIIGDAQPMNEAGITRVVLDDGSSVQFRGPTKQLTASNAEDLRRAINRLYNQDPTHASQAIKPAIDDALESALTKAADAGEGLIGDAYKAARDAHRQQRQTFHAKDIIDNLVAVKKGTETRLILPERAIAQTIGAGKDGVSNLRQVKALLMGSRHPAARQAWRGIQHQTVADIFDKAIQRNVNTGGDVMENISGAKLRTEIYDKVGVAKLRIVLDPEEFNQLMKLERIIGKATIPLSGTTNPSGTFTKLVNFLGTGTLKFARIIPGGETMGRATAALLGKARDLAATQKTLEGITSYDGRRETAERLDKQARDFIRDYIAAGKGGRLIPRSVNAAGTVSTQSQPREK